MNDVTGLTAQQDRFTRLSAYLDIDPGNLNLIADTASAAFDSRRPEKVLELVDRYENTAAAPHALSHLKGLAALQLERFDVAAAVFESLHTELPDDRVLRYNLAWAVTMMGDDRRAAELLDEAAIVAVPGAAVLKVQALHRLGDLESALETGSVLAETYPDNTALLGALSLVAVDMQMPDLALAWASKSQDTSEGLSTLGVLTLQQGHIAEAMEYFDQGLARTPDSARNLLGKGLAYMAAGQPEAAVPLIDQSAKIFGSHLGTWIAAGWAHFATGDRAKARSIFEHAVALDGTFSESHGALAVLDIMDGDIEMGRRRTETALRLDRGCFAGTLAKTMLLEHDGDKDSAKRLRDITLNTPLDSGYSIADALIAFSPKWRKPL